MNDEQKAWSEKYGDINDGLSDFASLAMQCKNLAFFGQTPTDKCAILAAATELARLRELIKEAQRLCDGRTEWADWSRRAEERE